MGFNGATDCIGKSRLSLSVANFGDLHKKNDEMRYWYTPWHILWQYSVKSFFGFSLVFVDVDLNNVYMSVIPTNVVGMEGDYFGR